MAANCDGHVLPPGSEAQNSSCKETMIGEVYALFCIGRILRDDWGNRLLGQMCIGFIQQGEVPYDSMLGI